MPLKGQKCILMGIFFVLLGLYCIVFTSSFSGFAALELVGLFSPLIGLGFALVGFFSKNSPS